MRSKPDVFAVDVLQAQLCGAATVPGRLSGAPPSDPSVKRRFKVLEYDLCIFRAGGILSSRGRDRPRRWNTSTTPRPYLIKGHSVLLALRRLLRQGALRVALVAVTTAAVMGFLSLVAASSQVSAPSLVRAKVPNQSCIPSHCRAKSETPLRNDKR